MKKVMLLIGIYALGIPVYLQAQAQYNYTADLLNIVDDQVKVTLQTPRINEDAAVFSFPKAIPGSYANKDFGRFIKDFKAFDKNGKTLPVKKINSNQFRINKARNLSGISYFVNDTWDNNHPNFVFQPGGSNIEAGSNVVMNNHAFFGYFEGYKALPFTISVTKPNDFYASTHLQVRREAPTLDVLTAKNYNYLADNPVLYNVPDTTSFVVGKSTINVSVHSATGMVTSGQVAGYLKPLSAALAKFFNGLPVTSYQFLFYFEDAGKAMAVNKDGGYGALEHNYSSLYFLPEIGLESRLHSLVNEVAGHEFLHIQTPLNLHSEEIGDFNFTEPKMSQHLWLYEGVTEYFSHLVQLQNGLIDEGTFFRNMRDKLNQAEEYGAFSMTEMSKNVLTEQYKSKYNSVYNKGALIGWMLDLFLRQKTNNTKDLKSVVQTLSKKYGPSKPFNDDELFDELIKASDPAVEGFIDAYIKGSEPLPMKEMLASIGYEYDSAATKISYHIGQSLSLAYDDERQKFVFKEVGQNALMLKQGDTLVSIQDIAVTGENLNELWEKFIQYNYNQPQLKLTVDRLGQQKVLEGRLFKGQMNVRHFMAPLPEPSDQQQASLQHFLNG